MVKQEVTSYDVEQSINKVMDNLYNTKMKNYSASLVSQLHTCTVDKRQFIISVAEQSIEYCCELKSLATRFINTVYAAQPLNKCT